MKRRALPSLVILALALWGAAARAGDLVAAMPIQVAGVALGGEASLPMLTPARPGAHFAAGVFAPAPMPDPDVEPPSGSAARGPAITPALFSHKEEFAGDGYASGSDADHGLDHRRAPAAGLNWSVPVK